jgi:hypothetical protein
MPIQKFKYGQEITSAKLNEIVSFVNNLEAFSNNAQFWNENIDSKIAGFQTQLNNIVNEIKSLLDTAENFDALLTAFVDLKNQYEALVAENVEALLENLFNPQSFFINPNGFVVIGGVVTSTQLTGIPGPQGATGATGATGSNGSNGKTIITNTGVPNNNTGTNGDVYFNVNNFDFYLKANDVWGLIGNTKGPQGSIGPQGASAQILFRYQTEAGLAYLSEPPASALVKFMEFKVIYSNETNQQIELKPWVRLQVRNDRFFPVLVQSAPGQVVLNWSPTEGEWPTNGINIKGEAGTNGINGTNGTNGTSVNIKGNFDSHLDLPSSNAVLGDGYLIDGDLWVYTGGVTSGTPPDVDSVFRGFLNVGSIEGPPGPAPTIQAVVGANLSPNENASVSVEPIVGVEGGYKLNFSIPRGQTGTRGSLIFNVNTVNDLPTGESWEGNTLRVNDLFIVNTTGGIYRITQTSPWVAPALIYSAAASDHTHGNITNVGAIGTTSDQVVVTGTSGVLTTASRSGIDSRSTFTPSSHTHGNITNAGAIGGTSGLPIITTTSGVLTTGSFGTAAGTFTQGNDARLSDARTPTSHLHGNITNAGAIGTTATLPIITTTNGVLTTGSFGTTAGTFTQGNDARLSDARTPTSHLHGNITNAGAIGTTATLPIITTTNGVLTTGSFGTTAGTFTQGNDARLSDARTPTAHTHGNITNVGAIGSTADEVVVTGTNGVLTTSSRSGIDSRSTFTPSAHEHPISAITNLQTSLDGKAASSHTHGNINNQGAIGTTASLPIITSLSGVLTTGSFGTAAGTFAQGNHTHGDITNAGAIGSTVITPATGDAIILSDTSASNALKRGISIGTSTTTFLRNDGFWDNFGYGLTSRLDLNTAANSPKTMLSTSTLPVGAYIIKFNGAFFKLNATAAVLTFVCRFSNSGFARIVGSGSFSNTENAFPTNNFYLNSSGASDTQSAANGFLSASLNFARNNVIINFEGMISVIAETSFLIRMDSGTASAGLGLEAGSGFTLIKVA